MTRNYKDSVSVVLTRLEHQFFSLPPVMILGYHAISDEKTIVDIEQPMFERQIAFLEKTFTFVTLDSVVQFIKGEHRFPTPAVALTFDDGYKDVLTTVHPILQRKNIPATLFVMSDARHVNRKELENNKKLLRIKELQTLRKAGWEIGCHSATHANFANTELDVKKEIIDAKKELERQLNYPVQYFVYPKGLYSKKIVQIVKQTGFEAAFAFEAGWISHKTNLFTIPRTPVDATHTLEQFEAFFSRWGTYYLGSKQKWARIQQFHG